MTAYRDRLYRAYLSTHLETYRPSARAGLERDLRLFRALYRRFLPESRQAEILEVGCGTGSFLFFLQSEGYEHIHGIDLGEEQIAAARALGIDTVEVANGLPYMAARPEMYDLVVALDVLEHLTKDEVFAFLDHVHRALRPGGRVLLRTPNADSPYHSWIRYADFTHEVSFSPTSIRQVLRAAGFASIEVTPLEPHVHGLASAGRWMLWQVLKQLIRLYMLVEQGVPGSGVLSSNLCAVGQKA
jgi:2-polyprenyl-3-methyl-5-hydroxy-6-metoxy-1,4-benzoquinol methylase